MNGAGSPQAQRGPGAPAAGIGLVLYAADGLTVGMHGICVNGKASRTVPTRPTHVRSWRSAAARWRGPSSVGLLRLPACVSPGCCLAPNLVQALAWARC